MTDTNTSMQAGGASSDDFLTSIQEAEIKASAIITTAETTKTEKLTLYRQELKASQDDRINTYRNKSKVFLSEQSRKSTMERTAEVKKVAKDAQKFYTSKESAVKPLLKDAFMHLLGFVKN
jgi:hypothetical protein